MGIRVRICSALSQYANNQSTVLIEGDTVGQCLEELVKRYPNMDKVLFNEEGKLIDYIEIFVNNKGVYPEEISTSVMPNDEVYILCILNGG